MANGYGISKWEDAKQINKELKNLTDQPIYCVSEENLKQVLEHFNTKCAKSKEITTEAKKYIPGGVQHNLAFNFPFPMCMEKPKAHICMTVTAINTSISSKRAVRRFWEAISPQSEKKCSSFSTLAVP